MNLLRWQSLMHALDLPASAETYVALSNAYGEPHRHYHTRDHIVDCLGKFDALRNLATHPNAIELAIWFHDAVYEPYRADNEKKSADWATRMLVESGAAPELGVRVSDLILATRHAVVPSDSDTSILIDVDLSILGADADRYAGFEAEVRREYRWVPLFLYRKKRAEILASFLERPRIYASELFHSRYETRARSNLRAAIDALA